MSELSYLLLSHLWESSVFGVVCVILILALGRSWSFSRHLIAWASLLKLLVPFAAFAPLFALFNGLGGASGEGVAETGNYLEVTASALQIDTWIQFGEGESSLATGISWEIVLLGIWAVGILVLAAVWGRQYFSTYRIVKIACEPASQDWQALARRVWEKEIRKMPEVLVCKNENLLAGVFGMYRPAVVVPLSFDKDFDETEREAFLRHEFQHVYKRDTLWLFVQKLIRNLFWMHPLVWWLDRQISAEREILRDEEVIRKTENVTSYLNCLMKASNIKLPSSYATSVGIKGSPFAKRIESITRIGRSRVGDVFSAVGSVAAVSALTVFLSASLSLTEVRASNEQEQGKKETHEKVKVKTEPSLTKEEQVAVKVLIAGLDENGDKELALDRVYELITEDSTAAFEFLAGNFHAEKGELEKAVQFYQVAADKWPTFLRAIRNMAIIQVKLGKFEEAKVNFLKARELGAEDTTTLGLLGLCYLNTEDMVSAEHYYRLAIEKDPTVKDWQIGLAKGFLKHEKYAEAEELLVTLLEDAERDGDLVGVQNFQNALANARLALGK